MHIKSDLDAEAKRKDHDVVPELGKLALSKAPPGDKSEYRKVCSEQSNTCQRSKENWLCKIANVHRSFNGSNGDLNGAYPFAPMRSDDSPHGRPCASSENA